MWFLKHSKVLGCYKLPPLKGISSRDWKRLERKIGSGISGFRRLGGLPPLKETFVVFGLRSIWKCVDPCIIGFNSNCWVSLQVTSDIEDGSLFGSTKGPRWENFTTSCHPIMSCLRHAAISWLTFFSATYQHHF